MRKPLAWLVVTTCAGQPIPPVGAGVDPDAYEVHLVAFSKDAHLVLERVVGPTPGLELVVMRPARREQTRFGRLHRTTLDPWPGAAGVVAAIRESPTGEIIEKLGFTWPEERGDSETLDTELGSLRIEDDAVHLNDGDYDTVVTELADAEPVARAWYTSTDGRWAALALAYDGTPSTRDLRVIALEPAASQLLALRAFDHHQRRDYATALRLWQDAVRLDPSSAASHYNLGCAHARLGDAGAALGHLRTAVELGGDRFRKLAARDPDLDALRGSEELEAILRRQPADKKCPWKAWDVPLITCD